MSNEQVIIEDDDNKYLPKNPWAAVGPILLAVFIYVSVRTRYFTLWLRNLITM